MQGTARQQRVTPTSLCQRPHRRRGQFRYEQPYTNRSDAPQIIACTVQPGVQNFDLLIEDKWEISFGRGLGRSGLSESLAFSFQPTPKRRRLTYCRWRSIRKERENLPMTVPTISSAAKAVHIKSDPDPARRLSPASLHSLLRTQGRRMNLSLPSTPEGELASTIIRLARLPRTYGWHPRDSPQANPATQKELVAVNRGART